LRQRAGLWAGYVAGDELGEVLQQVGPPMPCSAQAVVFL